MSGLEDYTTLLSSMSAMSQQFAWSAPRSSHTPQRVSSQRSRIQKSSSRNPSPQHVQRRTTAPTVRRSQATAGASYTGPTSTVQPSSFYLGSLNYPAAGYHQRQGRPSSWQHPYAPPQPPSCIAGQRSSAQRAPHVIDKYGRSAQFVTAKASQPQYLESCSAMSHFPGPSNNPTAYQSYLQTSHSEAGGIQQMYNTSFGSISRNNAIPINAHQAASANYAFQEPKMVQHDDEEISEAVVDNSKDLVGISLYDNHSSSVPSQTHTSYHGMLLSQPAGKGLKLEETWAPPAEDVPDAEADDGLDTPTVTGGFDFSPLDGVEHTPFQSTSTHRSIYEGGVPHLQEPFELVGEPFVFDEEMAMLATEWAMNEAKSLPVDWNDAGGSWMV